MDNQPPPIPRSNRRGVRVSKISIGLLCVGIGAFLQYRSEFRTSRDAVQAAGVATGGALVPIVVASIFLAAKSFRRFDAWLSVFAVTAVLSLLGISALALLERRPSVLQRSFVGSVEFSSIAFDTQVDQLPILGFSPAAPFPPSLLQSGTAGSATVSFVVTVDGTCSDVVVKDATAPEFGEVASSAVSRSRFRPALDHSRPVAVRGEWPFHFTIEEKAAQPGATDNPGDAQ